MQAAVLLWAATSGLSSEIGLEPWIDFVMILAAVGWVMNADDIE